MEKERYYTEKSSIAFDDRVLTIFMDKKEISIWTVKGRIKIPFVCGDDQIPLLVRRVGQSDLVIENGELFLLIGYEEKEEETVEPKDFLIDLGICKLAVDSTKEVFTGDEVEKHRKKYAKKRKALQQKGTKNAKRALCKIRKKRIEF